MWDAPLERLAASVGLGVDAMDTTGDQYVLQYLERNGLAAIPTRLASIQLPMLGDLPPRELVALLSSNEALAEVRKVLDNLLRRIPEGYTRDPNDAVRWFNDHLTEYLESAVVRLSHSIRQLPDAAVIGGTAGGVAATVIAGELTGSSALALGVNAAGAAASGLAASWLYQRQQNREHRSAIRVLTHLASWSRRAAASR